MNKAPFLIPFLIPLLSLAFEATAQLDSLALWRKYEKEAIYFSGSGYIKGDQKYPIRDLKKEFEFSPLGKEVYRMSRSDKNMGRASVILGFVSYSVWINSISKNTKHPSPTPLLATVGFWGISIPFSIRSVNRMNKAVWLRNRDVLLRK